MRIAALICLVIGAPASAEPLRLADVLRRATEVAPEQAVARSRVPIAQAEVGTARMWPNPTLSLMAGRAEPIFSAAFAARLPILGQRGAHITAAARTVDQTRAEVEITLRHLRHDARVAYYTVARSDEEVAIAVDLEALTGRIAAMADERFTAGAGNRLEREQAALLHVRAQQDVSDRRAVAANARVELARVIGGIDAAAIALVDPLSVIGPTPSRDALVGEASDQHPSLRALSVERDAALLRARAARADRRPTPTAEIGVDVLEPSTCGGTQRCVGPRGTLSLDLPLFNWNGGPVAAAEAEARAAEAKREAARQSIAAAVSTTYTTFAAAGARARFFDADYLPAATSVEAMAREGFSSGRTGLLPLIEAERAVLEARMGRAGALFTVQTARADLEEASGVPLSTP